MPTKTMNEVGRHAFATGGVRRVACIGVEDGMRMNLAIENHDC